ncbi:hypothetical protein PC116_g12525 [Phytophthora cactorum]|uniref:Uncharacterized protein n=1 Tax=Phytophthora cactorum TaxID=29920 RepID=A0A8T1D0C7_9STRA|nr:hypothetical protein PC114_g13072 [Phytophthora cactorum]KAG2931798.1 hypothetical protein PC117_g13334 [Phytophthora cactorum]KAG3015461.1 hypothetical protein PC120_g12155 [Phytophthora cactorum]KAG3031387.1 hypothetical protein PC119_g5938 [Phytophthora cactorum]KAG3067319.1 hypothetical protein PC121_g10586 [Phytophthora cactorum]
MAATEQGWVSADQQAVAEEDGEAVCGPAPVCPYQAALPRRKLEGSAFAAIK